MCENNAKVIKPEIKKPLTGLNQSGVSKFSMRNLNQYLKENSKIKLSKEIAVLLNIFVSDRLALPSYHSRVHTRVRVQQRNDSHRVLH